MTCFKSGLCQITQVYNVLFPDILCTFYGGNDKYLSRVQISLFESKSHSWAESNYHMSAVHVHELTLSCLIIYYAYFFPVEKNRTSQLFRLNVWILQNNVYLLFCNTCWYSQALSLYAYMDALLLDHLLFRRKIVKVLSSL